MITVHVMGGIHVSNFTHYPSYSLSTFLRSQSWLANHLKDTRLIYRSQYVLSEINLSDLFQIKLGLYRIEKDNIASVSIYLYFQHHDRIRVRPDVHPLCGGRSQSFHKVRRPSILVFAHHLCVFLHFIFDICGQAQTNS